MLTLRIPADAGTLTGLTLVNLSPASCRTDPQPDLQPRNSNFISHDQTSHHHRRRSGRTCFRHPACRHFHSLRISRAGLPPDARGLPLVLYTNHASWWDPLVGLVVKAECFPDRTLFTPIDATMLERYKMFAKLGFFGGVIKGG